MECPLCSYKQHFIILNKKNISIWTNTDDISLNKSKYRCLLYQCKKCGHIYQPMNSKIRKILRDIYLSTNAQVSTTLGKGNWGLRRAELIINNIKLKNKINKYNSVIEIGCSDGYFLKYLKKAGLSELIGIDPSVKKTGKKDGILFIKDFVCNKIKLSTKVELIFGIDVFEHIENINNVFDFCRNNLKRKGELIFSIPNTPAALNVGDPSIFLHEHVHYFTKSSLSYLLNKFGFTITNFFENYDYWIITAVKKNKNKPNTALIFYNNYQSLLNIILKNVMTVFKKRQNDLIIHGASIGLHNILSWLNKNYRFILVDNDRLKQDKTFFSKKVKSLKSININEYNNVLIIPYKFFNEIKSEYINLNYKGNIYSIISKI